MDNPTINKNLLKFHSTAQHLPLMEWFYACFIHINLIGAAGCSDHQHWIALQS